jgi:hypothetical protein
MHPNLEMDSWRILSGGRLLEWEFAIMQETNLLRRGPGSGQATTPVRTGAPGRTWIQSRLNRSFRERLFLRHVRTAHWCVWTHGALSYGTIVASGQARRALGHCRLKTLVFYLKTCYELLMLWEKCGNTETSFLSFV